MIEEPTGDGQSQHSPPKDTRLDFSFINRKSRKDFPNLPDIKRREYFEYGSSVVTQHSLDFGVMSEAETLDEGSENLNNQARNDLFDGAAIMLAFIALGYPNGIRFDESDADLWQKQFLEQEVYLHELFEDRKGIPDKTHSADKGSATETFLTLIEKVLALPEKMHEAEIEKLASLKAGYNLGINDDRKSSFKDVLGKRTWKEKDYYRKAVAANRLSHGQKGTTLLGGISPNIRRISEKRHKKLGAG